MIAGLELPTEGEITIGEKVVSNLHLNTGILVTSFKSMRCFLTWMSGTTLLTVHE
jgi:ABC-type sugar transport system ATPase subunit